MKKEEDLSRKWRLSQLVFATAVVLFCFGRLTEGGFITLLLAGLSIYCGANILEKGK